MCVRESLHVFYLFKLLKSIVLFSPDNRPLMWELFDDVLYGLATCAIMTIFYFACFYSSFRSFLPGEQYRHFIIWKPIKKKTKVSHVPLTIERSFFLCDPLPLWLTLSLSKLYHLTGMCSLVSVSQSSISYLLPRISLRLSVPLSHHLQEGPYLFFTCKLKLSVFWCDSLL